jgi:predicted TPR repeat methyltransferase
MTEEEPFSNVRACVERYYDEKLRTHGATHRGVDWNSVDSQRLRFVQLLRAVEPGDHAFSLLDYGCGYGALADDLAEFAPEARYTGFDLSQAMVATARSRVPTAAFTSDPMTLTIHDYVVASGIFSVRLAVARDVWRAYIRETLSHMRGLARRAVAFNMLTAYSDVERMRDDLYYADPLEMFTHCRTHLTKRAALLHDYPLYEFTIVLRFA